jgi:PTS system ascorbate-specific IIA component
MFQELIDKRRVVFAEKFSCWEDAVRAAALPLVRDGAIEEGYIEAMIQSIKEHGPYIVIAPNIAMPHAQGGKGVFENSFSFMKVEQPVHFGSGGDHDAQLIFVLAAVDNQSHLGLLSSFVEAVSEEEFVEKLLAVTDLTALEKLVATT